MGIIGGSSNDDGSHGRDAPGNYITSELVGDGSVDPELFNGKVPPARKKRHARMPEVKTDVNINSLLDILSVILVFLLKSFATSTVQVKPSNELQIPFSESTAPVEESVAVTVTLNNILVNDRPVLRFVNGELPEGVVDRGYLVGPLATVLDEEVRRQELVAKFNKAAEFKGLVTIIADRNVSFRLLTQVMYTIGQARFSKYKFATIKAAG
ncbi:MAG: biopolymer transporter ExbD [Clostridia bacterium]|nr:biopolymer transporter ExbD [Deltaproteobacteria bacterium]